MPSSPDVPFTNAIDMNIVNYNCHNSRKIIKHLPFNTICDIIVSIILIDRPVLIQYMRANMYKYCVIRRVLVQRFNYFIVFDLKYLCVNN